MIETKTEPSEVELVVPRFVLRDRSKEIAYWADQMAQAMAKMAHSELDVSVLTVIIGSVTEWRTP